MILEPTLFLDTLAGFASALRCCTRLSLALLAACANGDRPQHASSMGGTSSQGTDSMSTMQPNLPPDGASTPSATWERGPALTSSASELAAWFAAQISNGAPRITRVPLLLSKGPTGWSTTGVGIGALRVHVNDAALGIGLAMRAQACTETPCAFLVEGVWRGAVDGADEYEVRQAPARPMTAAAFDAVSHVEVARDR